MCDCGAVVCVCNVHVGVWGACGGGCQLDRPMDRLITGAGFDVPDMQAGYLGGFRFTSYVYSGKAWKR